MVITRWTVSNCVDNDLARVNASNDLTNSNKQTNSDKRVLKHQVAVQIDRLDNKQLSRLSM